jgi:hypothetical protein
LLLLLLLVMLLACLHLYQSRVLTGGVLPGWGAAAPGFVQPTKPAPLPAVGRCPLGAAALGLSSPHGRCFRYPAPSSKPPLLPRLALIAPSLSARPCAVLAHRSLPRLLLSSCALNSR